MLEHCDWWPDLTTVMRFARGFSYRDRLSYVPGDMWHLSAVTAETARHKLNLATMWAAVGTCLGSRQFKSDGSGQG